jgi:hypothetical protein
MGEAGHAVKRPMVRRSVPDGSRAPGRTAPTDALPAWTTPSLAMIQVSKSKLG